MRWPHGFGSALEHGAHSAWTWIPYTAMVLSAGSALLTFRRNGVGPVFWLVVGMGLVAALFAGWRSFRRHLRSREMNHALQLVHLPEAKIPVLSDLIGSFSLALKAARLTVALSANARKAKILHFQYLEGRLGAVLDIGTRDDLELGTPLVAFRLDSYANDGRAVESRLCSLSVTHVQANANLSQASVELELGDRAYWKSVRRNLRETATVQPPRNRVEPLVHRELSGLSADGLISIINALEQVRTSLSASLSSFR